MIKHKVFYVLVSAVLTLLKADTSFSESIQKLPASAVADSTAGSQGVLLSQASALPVHAAHSYPSLAAAVTSIGASNAVLVISNQLAIPSNISIPSTIQLKFSRGGQLIIAINAIVSINGPVDAGLEWIFSGEGLVKFNKTTATRVYPQWWGAKGDGVANDTIPIQKAINAAQKIDDGVVFFSNAHYRANGLKVGSNISLVGAGEATIKVPDGDDSHTTAIVSNNNQQNGNMGIKFINLKLDGNYSKAKNGTQRCIYFNHVSNSVVQKCTLRHPITHCIEIYGMSTNNSILNNIVEHRLGAYPDTGDSCILLRSPISKDDQITNPLPSECVGNFVKNNTVSGGRWGVNLVNSSKNIVSDNTIYDCTDRTIILYATCCDNVIFNNVCKLTCGAGILLNIKSSNNIIKNNSISDIRPTRGHEGQGAGILVEYDSSDNTISKNIISNSSRIGIGIYYGSSNIIISENTIDTTSDAAIEIVSGHNTDLPNYVEREIQAVTITGNMIKNTGVPAISVKQLNTTFKIHNLTVIGNTFSTNYSIFLHANIIENLIMHSNK